MSPVKPSFHLLPACLALCCCCANVNALERYVSPSGGHVTPFTNWVNAATNIQDAIDAASAGDLIWVTNGLYVTGGKVMAGDLTNRVALDKALTVQSVNGWRVTVIQGTGATNGLSAVRCAWLTNGATLKGFALRGGATRTSGDTYTLQSGGGVWCASSNAIVANCALRSNAANSYGGGAYRGTCVNSLLAGNNSRFFGGGSYGGILNNCTVVSNFYMGTYQAKHTNSIVYSNAGGNYSGGMFSYSCTTPLPSGTGNITNAPQFYADGVHQLSTSPSRAAGTNLVTGTDIDGQAWANPPSIGCDEWQPAPLIVFQPEVQLTSETVGFAVGAVVAGQEPFACWWTRDGAPIEDDGHYSSAHTTNLVTTGIKDFDAGDYQVVVSNAFGMATSAVVQLTIHYVDAACTSPSPPYLSWSTAATTIQDAIDAASPGVIVLVTNGVYATGGKTMAGDLSNRVALTKPLAVVSMNGPAATVIQGAWDPTTTNGDMAVRCAWLTNGAVLSGFTLQGGATRATGDSFALQSGGGVWCASTNAAVISCVIASNAANYGGGGCYQGRIINCRIVGNRSQLGGGLYQANPQNCFVSGNTALQQGGGAYESMLVNCTVADNCATFGGGGISGGTAQNCIVYYNTSPLSSWPFNWDSSTLFFSYSCTTPSKSGAGNITNAPQRLDEVHLAVTSPCRGAGSALYASGTDIDGEPWADPPSMGCDEVWEEAITGPLSVSVEAFCLGPAGEIAERAILTLVGTVNGRASRVAWSFGDGSVLTNASHLSTSHVWTNAGDYTVTFTAYNADHPDGVSTNLFVHVVPLELPVLATSGMSSNGFQLTFNTQYFIYYVVEYATNLTPVVVWQTLTSRFGTGGEIEVWDASTANAARFYRVRIP